MLKRRVLFGLTVSGVFFVLVFWRVDFSEFASALREANYAWLIPAVAVYFAAFTLRAWRWQHLMAHLGDVSLGRSYRVATIGYAANNVLPLRLGEFLRAYLLRQNPGLGMAAALATIAVERILDGLTLLLWLGLGLLLFSSVWSLTPAVTVVVQLSAVVFVGAGLTAMSVVLFPARAMTVVGLVMRPLPDRWEQPLTGLAGSFLEGLSALRRGRKFPLYLVLSNAIWFGEVIVYVMVAWALGIETPLVVIIAAVAASNLATTLPSSSGGIGPFELLAKETLVRAGVGGGPAAAFAILVHATLLVPVTIAGGLLLFAEGVSLRDAIRAPALAGDTPQNAEVTE